MRKWWLLSGEIDDEQRDFGVPEFQKKNMCCSSISLEKWWAVNEPKIKDGHLQPLSGKIGDGLWLRI